MDPTTGMKLAADSYGPYAFGLVSFVVIIAVLAWLGVLVWTRVIQPQLQASAKIAADNAAAQKDLNQTAETLRTLHREINTSRLEWMRYTQGQCPACGADIDGNHRPTRPRRELEPDSDLRGDPIPSDRERGLKHGP